MKLLFSLLAFLCCALPLAAQTEQDFASRFMSLHGDDAALECATVSPLMIERMMELPDSDDKAHVKQVLAKLKSIRVVSVKDDTEAEALYEKACDLARRNNKRYKPYSEAPDRSIYMRKRGKLILEIVLLRQGKDAFTIVNLTGNMTDAFLQELLQI